MKRVNWPLLGYSFSMKWIIRKLFEFSGWRVDGHIPTHINKAVFVGAPHTSNWDLFYTLGLMFTLNRNFRFLIKKEALVFPIKGFLLAMGAYPVERTKKGANSVEQIAKVFDESDECFLCIAPEGTRGPVSELKSGFYHIANQAKVPVVVGYLDYSQKKVHIGEVLDSSQPEAAVMGQLKDILKKAVAVKPENFTLLDK